MGLLRLNSRSTIKSKFRKIDCDLNRLEDDLYQLLECLF